MPDYTAGSRGSPVWTNENKQLLISRRCCVNAAVFMRVWMKPHPACKNAETRTSSADRNLNNDIKLIGREASESSECCSQPHQTQLFLFSGGRSTPCCRFVPVGQSIHTHTLQEEVVGVCNECCSSADKIFCWRYIAQVCTSYMLFHSEVSSQACVFFFCDMVTFRSDARLSSFKGLLPCHV